MPPFDLDFRVRSAAFAWLDSQKLIHGQVLPWQALSNEFIFEGTRVPFVGPQGIFKPAILPEYPLSITTSPNSPYDDELVDGSGVMAYRYRGTDPFHPDNVRLRSAMHAQIPLVYLLGTRKGWYLASYPVFVTADHPSNHTFTVQIDDEIALQRYRTMGDALTTGPDPEIRRQYVTVVAKRRLHQAVFRDRVITAYDTRCALCRLHHASLLDAAHIVPDSEPDGKPDVSNGLSLCKIHHAAFDQNFLGIRPDLKIVVRGSLLDEVDGPMLQHGIKAMHGQTIAVPRRADQKPNKTLLEQRFERFLASSNH